jgi:hypothetical protein
VFSGRIPEKLVYEFHINCPHREVEYTVAKIGRNDPCPCGSGKKYKHCCLQGETTVRSEVISRDRAWQTMMDELLDFSREDRFRPDLISAFDLFWNRSYTLEEVDTLNPMQIMSFLNWYAHDYSTSSNGRRIVETFLTERGSGLSQQEFELLEAARDSLFSAYEVTDVEKWRTISLLDVFQDLAYGLQYTPALEEIAAGQLLLGRLAATDGFRRFSWIAMLVPAEIEDDLISYIQEMFVKYQEDHYQASWQEFLRERSYLFNHFMLEVRGELPSPKIFLPYDEEKEIESDPLVLTPRRAETKERPSVLVPGQQEGEPPSVVLIPGRDD